MAYLKFFFRRFANRTTKTDPMLRLYLDVYNTQRYRSYVERIG